jgi:chemotaxis signal transduction protein
MSTSVNLKHQNNGSLTRLFLLYTQGASSFAVDLTTVREVLDPREQTLSPVPNTQPFLLGLMNLRGEILAVADFGRFINLQSTDLDHFQSRILVLEINNPQNIRALPVRIGLTVSQVQGVLSIYPDQVVSAAEVSEEIAPFLRGLYDYDGRLLMILDVEAIAQSDRW